MSTFPLNLDNLSTFRLDIMSTQNRCDGAVFWTRSSAALNMATALGPFERALHCLGIHARFLCEIGVTRARGECLLIEALADMPEDSKICARAFWIGVNLVKPLAAPRAEGGFIRG
jgi:hypothetical protein